MKLLPVAEQLQDSKETQDTDGTVAFCAKHRDAVDAQYDDGEVKEVPRLVVLDGLLFLVELDNLAFSHGLNEETRMEAEEFGRVSVTDEDSRLVDVIKQVCMLMVPAVIVRAVGGKSENWGLFESILLFTVVVVVQSVWRAPPAGKFAAMCWGLLRALKGLVVICILLIPSVIVAV